VSLSKPGARAILPALRQVAAKFAPHDLDEGGVTTSPRASFTTTLPPVDPPDRAELLGQLVPTAIRRPPKGARIPNPFRLTLIGLLTAGFVPAWWLVQRTGRLMSLQSQQMELSADLVESSRHGIDASDVAAVREAVKNVLPMRLLLRVAGAALVIAVASAVGSLAVHGWSRGALRDLWFHTPSRSDAWSLTSLIALSASYLIAIAAMNRHTVALQQFALAFNAALGPDRNGEPLEPPRLVWGLRPMHVILGVAMAALGLFWGLPMMLGWAAFRSVSFDTTQTFRIALADRLQAITGIAPITTVDDHCADPQCRAPLPFDARYCPRCGKLVRQ